jgi:hypothetical protein
MRCRPAWAAVAVIGVLLTGVPAAAAQGIDPGPPGPFVVDLRGGTIGVSQDIGFYPALPADVQVPARAFGLDAGAHLYPFRIRPGTVGIGGSIVYERGTAAAVATTTFIASPQVSLNFGTANGWSYVSGGAGVAAVRSRFSDPSGTGDASRRTSGLLDVNIGAGARWFFTRHLAFGFDLRLHRIGAGKPAAGDPGTPAAFMGGAAVGFSLK